MKHYDFYVFGVINEDGSVVRDVVADLGYTIALEFPMPSNHPKSPGEMAWFESEGYHLKKWAEEEGVTAFCQGYMFDEAEVAATPLYQTGN